MRKPYTKIFPDEFTMELCSRASRRELQVTSKLHHTVRKFVHVERYFRRRSLAIGSQFKRGVLTSLPAVPILPPVSVKRDVFTALPDEICLQILSYLSIEDLCVASEVSREWNRIANDNILWKIRCFIVFGRAFVATDLVGRLTGSWKENFRLLQEVSRTLNEIAGTYHSVCLTDNGKLLIWGSNVPGNAALIPRHFSSLISETIVCCSIRFNHFLALGAHGEVWSWGCGENGRLGHGSSQNIESPTRIAALRGRKMVYAAAGTFHSAAISAGGELYMWGKGANGELGVGDVVDSAVPRLVESLLGTRVKSISIHGYHSLAISNLGQVYAWGLNTWGQLGLGHTRSSLTPQIVPELNKVIVAVTSGWRHSVLLSAKGRVYTCGSSLAGQCGHGDNHQTRKIFAKVRPLKGVRIKQISAAGHTMALGENGGIWCWGLGRDGQLGNGERKNSSKPIRVVSLLNTPCVSISAGGAHSVAITVDGVMLSWGQGSNGQLGHSGRTGSVPLPTPVNVINREKLLLYTIV